MMRLSVAAAFLAFAAFASPASAFGRDEGYGDYGYQMPNKYQRNQPAKEEPSLFGLKKKSKAQAKLQNDEDDDKPAKKKKGPAEADGGGRPDISPVSPPTVAFSNSYGAGSIVIDTAGRKLYYVLSSSKAYAYPISVGKQGFAWTGTEAISRKVAWPDWRPPAEMIERRPDLPEIMTGGVRNPLGAMALYLGNSLYRIHGTNDVKSIGQAASSGCFRMMNGHVVHLASIAKVGTTVRVLSKLPSNVARADY